MNHTTALLVILLSGAISLWLAIWVTQGMSEPYQDISPPHCYEANMALQDIIERQRHLSNVIDMIKEQNNDKR